MEVFWVPFAVSLAVPARWGLRITFLTLLTGVALIALSPLTPWEELQGFEGLSAAILAIFFGAVLAGVTLRLGAELLYARPVLCREKLSLRWADAALATLAGVFAATVTTLILSVALSGSGLGFGLHLGLSATAFVLGVVCLRITGGLLRAFLAGTCLAASVLLALGGVFYPDLVLTKAKRPYPGLHRCLRTPALKPPTMDEMRLLTLPKAHPFIAGLTLTIMTGEGPKHFRWSYRSLGFRRYNSATHGACPPGPALP